jgi:DNA gyrase inhibitor GyrI
MKKKYILALCLFLGIGIIAWGPMSSAVEQTSYKVIETVGSIEIRDYDPIIVAQVTVSGDRKEAISKGFRLLADYIFGKNQSSKKIPMTAPVTQQASEKIPMTAPVTQQKSGDNQWNVGFVMPSSYTLLTLPIPHNPDVILKELPAKRFAVIRFSGIATGKKLAKEQEQLKAWLKEKGVTPIDSPLLYAFFNPPWTLPFFRRNEIMIELTP